MKKYWCALLLAAALFTLPAAAADAVFPVPYTGEDGVTNWGYMDDEGKQALGFFYSNAECVDETGLAVVQDAQGLTGVVREDGTMLIEYQKMPLTVDIGSDMIAFRYTNKSVYYTVEGKLVGSFDGATGFFSDGLLRVERNDTWGYVNQAGAVIIAPAYKEAGDFVDGYAAARTVDDVPVVLDRNGFATILPGELVTTEIYEGGLIVLQDADNKQRTYSLLKQEYLTGAYDEILAYHGGYALFRQGERWGILTARGSVSVEPKYYYLDYLGEGVYAARGSNTIHDAVTLIDGSGAYLYSTESFEGGFVPFRYGLSWHATADGGIIFFNRNGVIVYRAEDADEAEIVGDGIAVVTKDDTKQYVRLSDGKVLYTPERKYQLENGVTVETKLYEKYLGTDSDGKDYGWKLEYPQFNNMMDSNVQSKINTAIEHFFIAGPSVLPAKKPLEGSYGFTFQGRVLIVYADARIGSGDGSTIWNDNIMLDYSTGEQYNAAIDLLKPDYKQRLTYPENTYAKEYSYPRVQKNRLYLYRLIPATLVAPVQAQEISFALDDITSALQTDGACYQALTVQFMPKAFQDVPADHWAYEVVNEVTSRGLMQGDLSGYFKPDAEVRLSEACQTIFRALNLPEEGEVPGIDPKAWYAPAMGALYQAGILKEIDVTQPNRVVSRLDAFRLMANVLKQNIKEDLDEKTVSEILSPYTDVMDLPADAREAAALCIREGVVTGVDNALHPDDTLTRASFAALIARLTI